MHLEIHRQIPDHPKFRQAWNALVEKMEQPEVFYTWEWAKAMATAYGESLTPWLALAHEGDALVGVAALALNQNRAAFLAGTTADYCDFLSTPQDRAAFVDLVLAELRNAGCTDFGLANLPKDSATSSVLKRASQAHGFHAFARHGYECAQVRLGTAEDRQRRCLELDRKKWFRRNRNALNRSAKVALRHLTAWDEVEPALPAFARAHVARFLSAQRISNVVRGDRRLFLHELARQLCDSGWFRLTGLMWGDRPIAWNYGFRFGQSWFWYQPTIDSQFEDYSPGKLLLANMIIEAANSPALEVVDLGLGAEEYKEQFANTTRTTLYVTLSCSVARTARESVRYRLAETVKRSPRAEAEIRRGLSRVEAVGRRFRGESFQQFARWASGVVIRSVTSLAEVRFYQWPDVVSGTVHAENMTLRPMNLDDLAQMAIDHENDAETAAYLLRSASRLKSGAAEGFVLFDTQQKGVHLCWAREFEGFAMAELQTRLSPAPAPDAWLIFDCWTPLVHRGHGYYGIAIAMLADLLRQRGRSPWIFSAATNAASIQGIENAGFAYRYSMISQKTPRGRSVTIVQADPQLRAPLRS